MGWRAVDSLEWAMNQKRTITLSKETYYSVKETYGSCIGHKIFKIPTGILNVNQ